MMHWILLGVLGILLVYYWYKRPRNFPPGPRGFPLIGAIPYCGSNLGQTFAEWKNRYGSIMSVRMGREDFVILQDFNIMQKALVSGGSVFSGRPLIPIFQKICQGHGIIFIDYDAKWKSQRKFGIRTLKGIGVGSKTMEERIVEETEQFMNSIQSECGKPFDMLDKVTKAASNNICSVVFGERFEYDSPVFKDLLDAMERGFSEPKTSLHINLISFAPILAYLPPFLGSVNELMRDIKYILNIFTGIINEHKKTYDSENIRDFIDAFLLEMNGGKDLEYTDTQLLQFVRDLFVAGTETTSTTIRWSVLCLLHFPEAEKKLYRDIEKVVGASGTVKYSHKDQMPYVSAFIEELFRYRTLAPLGLHKTTEEVKFEGYILPKNTSILPNFWAIHNDPTVWRNPEKFLPERHLNEKGEFIKSNHVIPFGIGPRHCLGEQLARMEVFIFLGTLVQKFRFKPNPNISDLPDINEGCFGNVFAPLKYKVVAEER